jgi:glycerol-3-phosphate acyltransferase PlsY
MSSIAYYAVGILVVVVSYIVGSISFAVVVSRAMGLDDPRTFGSKNPGATNVLRTGNRTAALLTLLGDAAKGWFAVTMSVYIATLFQLPLLVVGLAAVAVFLGHLYPLFLGFQGGKGVATAVGVLMALQPWLALATIATWIILAYASRYSSLAAIVSAVFAPLYYAFGGRIAWEFSPTICGAIVVISALLLYRHKANIGRLLKGEESKIGASGRNKSN